jgi:hypothetical protein
MKKFGLAVLAIFVSWEVIDFILHGVILQGAYEATASLWRPMEEMKTVLMIIVVLLAAIAFAWIYYSMIGTKSMYTGVKYGLIFGFGIGVSMGYGTYSVMEIPYFMAFAWFLGSVIEGAVGGFLLGLIVKE